MATKPGLPARQVATKLLGAVVDKKTSLDGLTDAEHGHPHFLALDGRDRALVRAILASALRRRVSLATLIDRLLDRPLPENARALAHLLHVAAAQILLLDVPASAAVDLAVAQAKADPRTARFSGLVNAILRKLAASGPAALGTLPDDLVEAPEWFAARLGEAYGARRMRAILAAHLHEAPVDFTVKSNPEGCAARLGGIVLPWGSVRVEKLDAAVPELPGFAEGEWWVQDAAASLPARLVGARPGLRVADLCAAPGGKTAQLALAGAKVTAFDLSASRLSRLKENLARLKLDVTAVEADILHHVPAAPFDAVLIDAPCSSTGTVRRHPDVPWTKSPADIAKLAALQYHMLEAAMRFIEPGGIVVYSNCSLDPAEGEELIARFLSAHAEVAVEPVRPDEIPGADGFIDRYGALRTTPADLPLERPSLSGVDGFYAARLRRVA
jgi:16S rRNA (cytosine967-C5)-methyltransferase